MEEEQKIEKKILKQLRKKDTESIHTYTHAHSSVVKRDSKRGGQIGVSIQERGNQICMFINQDRVFMLFLLKFL
jgi:hypothetical protein